MTKEQILAVTESSSHRPILRPKLLPPKGFLFLIGGLICFGLFFRYFMHWYCIPFAFFSSVLLGEFCKCIGMKGFYEEPANEPDYYSSREGRNI